MPRALGTSEVLMAWVQEIEHLLIGGLVDFTPVWKTTTREHAVEILTTCRAWTDGVVGGLSPKQRTIPSALGDGTWSVKDLLGHLATHEHRALIVMGARRARLDDRSHFEDVHAFNAHHLERKRRWSLTKVERDYETTRDELVRAIETMDDDRWLEKIPYGPGRSALALVLGKMLNGDKFGLFAHDFAHRRDLEQALTSF